MSKKEKNFHIKKVHQNKIGNGHISNNSPVNGNLLFQGNGIGAKAFPPTIHPEMELLGLASSTLLS